MCNGVYQIKFVIEQNFQAHWNFYFERFPRGTLIVKILKYLHQTRVFEVLSEGVLFILTILLFNYLICKYLSWPIFNYNFCLHAISILYIHLIFSFSKPRVEKEIKIFLSKVDDLFVFYDFFLFFSSS
jgi:hypothetical protein